MTVLANTRVTVLRGTETNDHGDPVDTDTEVAGLADMPISILEQRMTVAGPATGRATEARFYAGRPVGTWGSQLQEGDRLRVGEDGPIYAIDFIGAHDSAVLDLGPRLELRRVT